jgi:hypothetical protein
MLVQELRDQFHFLLSCKSLDDKWKQFWGKFYWHKINILQLCKLLETTLGHHGHDRMVVELITTYAISAYHHYRCKFESRSGEVYSIQLYVIKFGSDLRQVGGFLQVLQFPPPINLTATIWLRYCWKWC